MKEKMAKNDLLTQSMAFVSDVRTIIERGRKTAYAAAGQAAIATFWHVGRRIVEEEQEGKARAEYGKSLMKNLADNLVPSYGNSYSKRNLDYYRKFYLLFPDIQIVNARVHNLEWTHIRRLLSVTNPEARLWYLTEASENNTNNNYQFRYIDISNVSSEGEISICEEMTFYEAPSRARRIIRKGDIIVSTIRTYLRSIAFIDFNATNFIASTGFAVLSPINNVESKYLAYSLRDCSIVDAICSQSTGVSYPAITASKLASVDVVLPPLTEQQSIAAYLDEKCAKIDAAIANIDKQADALKRLKRSLINEVISGKRMIE